jgi:hypothetical protein
MKKFAVQDLGAPGWLQVITLTCSWAALRWEEDVVGLVGKGYKVQRDFRVILEGLWALRLKAKPELTQEAKVEILDIWPGRYVDQMGVVIMLLGSASRRQRAELATSLGKELMQALGAYREEAYARLPGKDLVHEARSRRDVRSEWMGKELPIDPLRAALVRAGRKCQVWTRLGSAKAELFEMPDVPPTEPVVSGHITVDGSVVELNDANKRLTVSGICKNSPAVKQLAISGRFFNCELADPRLYDAVRRAAPGKPFCFDVDVMDAIFDGGELRRSYRITDVV